MTRRHFEAIATILAEHRGMGDPGMYHEMVMDFARFCKKENSNFDTQKFLNWVGGS
jgi:hypothetical protein